MWSKKHISICKIQQSSLSTLKINLPIRFTKLKRLEKGDLVSCKIIDLSNGHVGMIVDKVVTNPTTLSLDELERLL